MNVKELYHRWLVWAYGTCSKHPEVILSGHILAPCEKCFKTHCQEVRDAIKAEEERKWHGQAKAVIDELDKRGLIVTHPSNIKGGTRK